MVMLTVPSILATIVNEETPVEKIMEVAQTTIPPTHFLLNANYITLLFARSGFMYYKSYWVGSGSANYLELYKSLTVPYLGYSERKSTTAFYSHELVLSDFEGQKNQTFRRLPNEYLNNE